jgi:hypothetical protein
MATTDVARVSYDWARRYSGVAPQQGRVTLEAEENEDRVILARERALELLDLIGPAATPDDGYAVSAAAANGDFTIGPGTMYVGGLRVELEQAIDYYSQPDFLDFDTDLDFGATVGANQGGNQHALLVLVEADVTATEDPVLREVALGGPDGAARIRLLQRIVALPTSGNDCASASTADAQWWLNDGLVLDPDTARLRSLSRLQVGFDEQAGADPCQPTAKGGYLGAENQALRVKVAAMNGDGTFDLLWGWDNASFLYRVTPDASANPILTLDRSPVDDYHRPAAGQPVEVLRATADLQSTDGAVEGYVAALNGQVGVLAAPYDPDTKTVQFPSPLPVQYLDEQTPQLFMRVWQGLIPRQQLGTAISLPGTGLNITLTAEQGAVLHAGDYWTIGVRPETPQNVLPARLLRGPQPPDGPRMWACPLAVIGWQDGAFELLDDCRVPFPECEGGCCTVAVRPAQAAQLQAIIDKVALRRHPADRAHRITICLQPGRFELERPIRLDHRHSHLVLEGCHEGVVIAAAEGAEQAFGQGLIEMIHADNVTISGIELELPQTPARSAGVVAQMAELKAFKAPLLDAYRDLFVSIGIRPIHCAVLEVERCLFRFTVGEGEASSNTVRNVLGIGIYAGSECWGMRVERCRFLHDAEHVRARPVELPGTSGASAKPVPNPVGAAESSSGGPRGWATKALQIYSRVAGERRMAAAEIQPMHELAGIVLMPNLLYRGHAQQVGRQNPASEPGGATAPQQPAASEKNLVALPSGALLRALITRGRIADNEFSGLTVGIYIVAQVGELRIEDNAIRSCYEGIVIYSTKAQAYADVAGNYTAVADVAPQDLERAGLTPKVLAADDTLMKLSVLTRTYPLPDAFSPSGKDRMIAAHVTEEEHKANQLAWMQQFVQKALAPFGTAAAGQPAVDAAPAEGSDQPAQAEPSQPSGASGAAESSGSGGPASAKLDATAQQLHTLLSQYELGAAFSDGSRWFELRVTGNDIECAAPFQQPAGRALRIWESEQPTGSALINDNRLTTTGWQAVIVLGVPLVICTANLIWAAEDQEVLSIKASEQISVMANISGQMPLPSRPQQAPIDTWPPLNTVV